MNKKWGVTLIALALGLSGCNSSDDSADSSSSTVTGTTTTGSSTSSSDDTSTTTDSSTITISSACDSTGGDDYYFCDNFSSGTLDSDNWADQTNSEATIAGDSVADTDTANGAFTINGDADDYYLSYTAGSAGGELLLGSESLVSTLASDAPEGNYYVEAKIRPRDNSSTAQKYLYLIGRYEDAGQWYLGGLNVQGAYGNTVSYSQVELGYANDFTGDIGSDITRGIQTSHEIELGSTDATDSTGIWYTVRLEMNGDTQTVYLNGEEIGSEDYTSYEDTGNFGLYTFNRSFDVDYIKVGPVSQKPVEFTIDYTASTLALTTGNTQTITVTAVKSDQSTTDSYTAVSSDSSVVSVSESDSTVTLTAVAAGTAEVTLTSGSDATLSRTITVTVTD